MSTDENLLNATDHHGKGWGTVTTGPTELNQPLSKESSAAKPGHGTGREG